jgi:small subunit ribosomal protein S15
MSVSTETKNKNAETVKKFGANPKDTGSAESQIAILTSRIVELTGHFKKHPKDHHSERGLLVMVGKRKRLLSYLQRTSDARYTKILKALELRK